MNRSKLLLVKIFELFNTHHDFETAPQSPTAKHRHKYSFATNKGNKYTVNINHYNSEKGRTASVSFTSHKNDSERPFDLTSEEKGSAHKVLSTIHHILKHHAEKHPEIKAMTFNADKDHEPVYKRMLGKFAHKHSIDREFGSTTMTVDKADLK